MKSQVRVLHVIPDERIGGPQLQTLQVASGFKRDVFINSIAMPAGDKTFTRLLDEAGIPYYQVSNFKRLPRISNLSGIVKWFFYFIPCIVSLVKLIRRNKVDIVHVDGSMSLQVPLAAKLSGAKLVWQLNDVLTPKLIRIILFPFLCLLPDKVISIAKAVESYFFVSKAFDKNTIIYGPVDTKKFHPDYNGMKCGSEFGLSAGDRVVGTVANISPVKGYEYFFPAVSMINRACPGVKFLVVGKKWETQKKYLQKLQTLIDNLEIGEELIFTGQRLDIPEMMNLMDIFVLPSVSEAAGLVVAEAMACARPVVATRVGGVPELVINGETGILVPPRDPKAIAEAVLYLLNNPEEAREMGLKGRSRAVKLYDSEHHIHELRQLYESLRVQ